LSPRGPCFLITLDLDFSNILAYPPAHFTGIVVLRLNDQAHVTVESAIQRVLDLGSGEMIAPPQTPKPTNSVTPSADQPKRPHHNPHYSRGAKPSSSDAVMRSILIGLMLCCCFAATTSSLNAATFRLASTAKPSSCQASDFALDELRSRHQHSGIYIVGRIMNNCDAETGVRIKVAILDHAGGILRVSDFWPASTENIPPHSGWPFQTELDGVDSFDRFQVTVIEVKRWTE
jgi:hypothetical protein